MPSTRGFTPSGIGQIAVPVGDLERAVAFYRDRLGLRLLFQVSTMAFFDCGGVRIALSVPEAEAFDHPASIIYYRVDDIHRASDHLRAQGVRFEADPRRITELDDIEVWMAFFRDPDDNLLALMSEVPTTG